MLDVPAGGFSLNVSEILAKLKQSAWRKREDRLRNAPLDILPEGSDSAAPGSTP
jgi:hypothetical protein